MQRIVTGHSERGQSVVSSSGGSTRIVDFKLGKLIELWATDSVPSLPDSSDNPETTMASFIPRAGGTRFRVFTIEPMPADASPSSEQAAAVLDVIAREAPGFAPTLEPDNLGMHTTDTIDYIVVISGEADLELDDNQSVHVSAGDCVVQRGTRHAWRNYGAETFVAAAVMIGAQRKPE